VKLYVDDVRPCPAGWTVARTPEEAQALLAQGGVDEVSLDYYIGVGDGGNFLSVAYYLAQMPLDTRPQRVSLHTSSEFGASQLRRALGGSGWDVPWVHSC